VLWRGVNQGAHSLNMPLIEEEANAVRRTHRRTAAIDLHCIPDADLDDPAQHVTATRPRRANFDPSDVGPDCRFNVVGEGRNAVRWVRLVKTSSVHKSLSY
jgi:hypothetical protein